MAELPKYPFINQLNSPTLDGKPDENKWFNCVLCSLLSAMLYYRPDLRGKIEPDSMKDAVYGQSYANEGTDIANFVAYVARFGLKLYPVTDMPGKLVEEAHALIQHGKPAIFTEIDPYCTDYQRTVLGWTHVCSFYKEIDGGLDAMDPFGGVLKSNSDEEWAKKIVGNQLWTVELIAKEDEVKLIELTDPEVSRYYGLATPDGNAWVCRQTGKVVQGGILAFYRKFGGDAFCGLTYLGLPKSNEIPVNAQGAKKQYFERAVVCYDPTTPHAIDNPPGAASIYLLQLFDDGPGTDPRVASLAPLQAQVTQLQAQLKAAGNSADTQKIAQIKAIVG